MKPASKIGMNAVASASETTTRDAVAAEERPPERLERSSALRLRMGSSRRSSWRE